jgi:hypothetical protein
MEQLKTLDLTRIKEENIEHTQTMKKKDKIKL